MSFTPEPPPNSASEVKVGFQHYLACKVSLTPLYYKRVSSDYPYIELHKCCLIASAVPRYRTTGATGQELLSLDCIPATVLPFPNST